MNQDGNVAVVYLSWVPYGPGHLRSFIQSYLEYPAGHPHDLYILFNGVADETGLDEYLNILLQSGISFKKLLKKGGQDIEAYREAVDQIDATYVLFLNTYSQFHDRHWLSKYYSAINSGNTGLVSATGSWQSYLTTVYQLNTWKYELDKGFQHNFRKYKLFLKAFFYWSFLFRSFPNPHARSNAFMLRRQHMVSLQYPVLKNKFQAYLFESGRNSLTNQILRKKLSVVVIDKAGNRYGPEQWNAAKVFWSGQQENLLVSDNQTRMYDDADSSRKKQLSHLAWGKQATV